MQNKNNIDELFSAKFENFEQAPPPEVWDRIVDSLDGKKKRKVFLFLRWSGVAASLIIAFMAGWLINQQINKNDEWSRFNMNINDANNRMLALNLEDNNFMNSFAVSRTKLAGFILQERKIDNKSAVTIQYIEDQKISSLYQPLEGKGSDEPQLLAMDFDALNEMDRLIINQNIESTNDEIKRDAAKWSMGLVASPDFSFNGNSAPTEVRNEAAVYNASSSNDLYDLTFSSGVNVEYAATKRLKFRSGIFYASFKQNSQNIGLKYSDAFMAENAKYAFGDFYGSAELANVSNKSQNIGFMGNMGVLNLSNLPAGTEIATAANPRNQLEQAVQNFTLTQQAEYVELPMIVKYELVQGTFSLNVLGGVNTNILINNGVKMTNKGGSFDVGTITGLKPITWSGTMGVGINYSLFDDLIFTMEPSMKYRLNSISTSKLSNQQPITLGVYTGFTYVF